MAASQSHNGSFVDFMCHQSFKSGKNLDLEDLYKCPWFFGELSEENAKEILEEAKQNDENPEAKTIIFLKTGFDDIKQKKHFDIVLGHVSKHDPNGQPRFYFYDNYPFTILNNLVMRENPFSLEALAMVKTATSGVDPESLILPKMIKDEVKKYYALNLTSSITYMHSTRLNLSVFSLHSPPIKRIFIAHIHICHRNDKIIECFDH